jgi:FAD/FMN-containing dehydrogenase
VETAFVGVPSPRAALDLLALAQARAGNIATSFELIVRLAMEFALRHGQGVRDPLPAPHPWYVILEMSSQADTGLRATMEDVLATGSERGIVGDAAIAASLEQTKSFWNLRMQLTESQKPEGGSIKHDVSVPVAAVPDFLAEASAAVAAMVPGCRPVPFGHLGDGNVHFNVSQPVGGDRAQFLAQWDAMNALVHGIATKYGGSISAEHGIGVLKRDLLPQVKDPVALDMMRALKRTLDPNNILNPGKVI